MTCPYYRGSGIDGGRDIVLCAANPARKIEFLFVSKNTARMYCLGEYPECEHFKKSEEVTHE